MGTVTTPPMPELKGNYPLTGANRNVPVVIVRDNNSGSGMDTEKGRNIAALKNDTDRHSDIITTDDRGQWGNWAEYVLSVIGLSVGLGNVWRFPYLAYKNGGGAFLIPYIIMLAVVGLPLYYLELAFGQYASLGPISSFKKAVPAFTGVGIGMAMISFLIVVYYNVLMAYILYFIYVTVSHLFSSELPWNKCGDFAYNATCYQRGSEDLCPEESSLKQTSAAQFWQRAVLQQRVEGSTEYYTFGNDGGIVWQLALSLVVAWILTFFCLIKGVTSAGKVVYFTAIFPYVMIAVLLIRGLTLPGAGLGIMRYITPDLTKLYSPQPWIDAASQIFFSLGCSMGGLIMMGSYNKFHQPVFRDAVMCSVLDTATGVLGGFVIFTILGHLSFKYDIAFDDVASKGPGLAFVIYPEGISQLFLPQLWSLCFFVMLYTLGVDSAFGIFETALTAIRDEIPLLQKHRGKFAFAACTVACVLGLPLVTRAGIDVLGLLDTFIATYALVFIALCEIIALGWVYSVRRINSNFEDMFSYRPHKFWAVCWSFIIPIMLLIIFIYSLVGYVQLIFAGTCPAKHIINETVPATDKCPAYVKPKEVENFYSDPFSCQEPHYPRWIEYVGWSLALFVMLQVPVWAVYKIMRQSGSSLREKLYNSFQPTEEWIPVHLQHARRRASSQNEIGMRHAARVPVEGGVATPLLLLTNENVKRKGGAADLNTTRTTHIVGPGGDHM